MSKHLNNQEIIKYRQASLLPSELLTVDRHLADCENCRQKIRQRQDLTTLYESFFEPLGDFSANDSKDADFRKQENWKPPGKFRFFSLATLLTNWQPQAALILVLILTVGATWILWQKPASPPADLLTVRAAPEDIRTGVLGNGNISNAASEKKTAPLKIAETDSENAGLKIKKGEINQTLAAKTAARPALKIEIGEIEADQSQTLSSNDNRDKALNLSPKLQIRERKNNPVIDFSAAENADEYEIYLAEMPKFVTVSREKVKVKNWTIPYRKLKAGQDYVLQITAFRDGAVVQSVKKIISTRAVRKN